jgi:hypothetical protein
MGMLFAVMGKLVLFVESGTCGDVLALLYMIKLVFNSYMDALLSGSCKCC